MTTDAEIDRAVQIFVAIYGGGEYDTFASPALRHCLVGAMGESDEFALIWAKAHDDERQAIIFEVALEFSRLGLARRMVERAWKEDN